MRLTMLGTGHAGVTECYNTCFILENQGQLFLVDGGGGNTLLRQLQQTGYNWMDIRDIFVTHKHLDHLLGILWMIRRLVSSMARGAFPGTVRIYSHREVVELLREMTLQLFTPEQAAVLDRQLFLVEVTDGQTLDIIGRPVTFFDIHASKARQFGFCMDLGEGRRLTCCGDEPLAAAAQHYAAGCEWLLHEAFCLHAQADIFKPYAKHHSTVKDACELAERLGVRNLLLYHTEDQNLARRKALYLAEGRRYYHGNLQVPDDLESIDL